MRKDNKKGNEDMKGKKGKDDIKNKKVEEIKPEMKVLFLLFFCYFVVIFQIDILNPLPQYDLMKEVKYTYNNLDIDNTNNTKPVYNSYTKNIALYMRACLRYINCYFTMHQQGMEVDEKIFKLLKKIETINNLSINFIVPISIRIELYYMFSLYYKNCFYKEIIAVQNEYI